jgi:hypothetical protein
MENGERTKTGVLAKPRDSSLGSILTRQHREGEWFRLAVVSAFLSGTLARVITPLLPLVWNDVNRRARSRSVTGIYKQVGDIEPAAAAG